MTALYSDPLIALSRDRSRAALPEGAEARAEVHNPLCGDTITVGVVLADGAVERIGYEAQACAVCCAAAAAMCAAVEGGPISAIERHAAALSETLRSGRAPDAALGPFTSLVAFPNRFSCAELPWRALAAALTDDPPEASAHSGADPSPAPAAPLDESDDWALVYGLLARGERCAVATLTAVVGSSPCPLGSRMIIRGDGFFWGSVSGGCVESAVVQTALDLLDDPAAKGRSADYQISNSQAGAVGLPCGGRVTVHVAPAPPIERVAGFVSRRDGGAVRVLDLDAGTCRLAHSADGPLGEAIRAVLDGGGPQRVEAPTPCFIEPLRAPPRLVLVGGTHVAQKLCRLAREVGFSPVVIEPREGWAHRDRFAVTVVRDRAERALPHLVDGETAVVTLTHERAMDDPALKVALASRAFYVGALGSRKTQQARLARLSEDGVPADQLARLHGPAGVPIGGKGAGEIALSILAEIVATRRRAARIQSARRVGAVVLAAGRSRRAGPINKLLHPVDGQPMIRRTVQAVLAAEVQPVLVVLGHEAGRVRAALDDLPVRFVTNADHADGMGRSIACGVSAIAALDGPDAVNAALVVLGDMPWLRAADIERIVAAHRASTQHLIAVPEAGAGDERRRGNPVLWPRRYFAALQRLEGEAGGRHILQAAPGAILRVPIEHPGVLLDVDTP